MEFQDLVIFLQHLPTTGWSDKEVGVLLSEAFVMKSHFHHSQARTPLLRLTSPHLATLHLTHSQARLASLHFASPQLSSLHLSHSQAHLAVNVS